MKIAIVGCGAMGSIYAGLLADAGNEVWTCDLWPEHLDAIENNGLRVEGASGDRTVKGIKNGLEPRSTRKLRSLCDRHKSFWCECRCRCNRPEPRS